MLGSEVMGPAQKMSLSSERSKEATLGAERHSGTPPGQG